MEKTQNESPIWNVPCLCIIDIEDFVRQARDCTHLVKQEVLIIKITELKEIAKRIVFHFIVDFKQKKTKQNCWINQGLYQSPFDKALSDLGVKIVKKKENSHIRQRKKIERLSKAKKNIHNKAVWVEYVHQRWTRCTKKCQASSLNLTEYPQKKELWRTSPD